MKYLIVNADDFGLSAPVNEGIMRAFEAGGITSATLMVKRESASEAIGYAKANPGLSVGLHLDLDELLEEGKKGEERFSMERIEARLKGEDLLDKVSCEIDCQIGIFKGSGLELTHIDGHHHLHAIPAIFSLLVEKMKEEGIKTMRFAKSFDLVKYPPIEWDEGFYEDMRGYLKKSGIAHADYFVSGWQPYELKNIKVGVTELMVHPGIEEDWRIAEFEMLTSGDWLSEIRREGIILTSFRDLDGERPR